MEKLKKLSIIKETPFIKRSNKRQMTEVKTQKIKINFNAIKRKKLSLQKEKRGSISTQQTKRPLSITFKNSPQTANLIKYIRLYKEMHSKKNSDLYSQKNVMKRHLINKIIELLKAHKGLYNFFAFYQISDKAIFRLARDLHFMQREKGEYLWFENDNSNKIYFLLKGKISLRKYVGTEYEREAYQENEDNIFGMYDILYERKRKLTCMALEECSYLYFNKDIFKLYMAEDVNKVLSERKKFLLKFFNEYLPIPAAKVERYISNSVENVFFRKNDIIYREGEKNISLYLMFSGEANLIKNINKDYYDILPTFNLTLKKLKENAKKIEYGSIIDNFKNEMLENNNVNIDKLDINSYKIMATLSKGSICGGLEICTGVTYFKYNLICNTDFCALFRIKLELFEDEHLKVLMVNLLPYLISKEKKMKRIIQNIKYIDYNIIPPSLRKFNDIKEMPNIINTQNKLSKSRPNIIIKNEQTNNLKDINNNLFEFKNLANNIQTEKNVNINKTESNSLFEKNIEKPLPNLINSINKNESKKAYQKIIKRIDDKFDTNEGGFIKLTNYNLGLLKQKNFVKLQITNNKRLDIKIDNFIKKYEEIEKNNLKTSSVKMNYLLNEEGLKNENTFFDTKNMELENSPNRKRTKSAKKSKKILWNFRYVSNFTPKYKDFINFYNNNFKLRKTKSPLSRAKLRHEMNEIMDKLERVHIVKELHKKISPKEIYDKLISFKSLNKDNKNNTQNLDSKNRNFIKELIILKKSSSKDEGTDTFNLENSLNNISNSPNRHFRTEINENKTDKVIKIVNNKYIDDLFFNNLKHSSNKDKEEMKKYNKNFFNDYYYNKFNNYDKKRFILYNTGQFDMPLASNISEY